MYSKLELPLAMAGRGDRSFDMEAALDAAYSGKQTTLVKPFAGKPAGTPVVLGRWTNAGFRGFTVSLKTVTGERLGLAPQEALDVDALLK